MEKVLCAEVPSSKNVLDVLFAKYYRDHTVFSDATSSHWRQYGGLQQVRKNGGQYTLTGVGFGDFEKQTPLKWVVRIPTSLYVRGMLKGCSPEVVIAAKWLCRATSRILSYDVARMSLTLDLLHRRLGEDIKSATFAVIGDGYGTLGCLIKKRFPQARVVFVNLGRTLFFDAYYTQQAFPEADHKLLNGYGKEYSEDFTYIEAEAVSAKNLCADVFINISSMQEMNPEVIRNYFSIMRSQDQEPYFYCCNRLEKTLPDGTITRFSEYGWLPDDRVLVDELCPWHQEYPASRPPFRRGFDGPHQHRLVKLSRRVLAY